MTSSESYGPEGPRSEPAEPAGRLEPAHGEFPPGLAESSHLFGPYVYRRDELVLSSASPETPRPDVEPFRRLLADPALGRRVFWDVLVTRFFGEFPPEQHPEPATPSARIRSFLATLGSLLRLVLVALPRGLRLPLVIEDTPRVVGSALVVRLRPVPGVPDLVPALVQRLLRFSAEPPPRVTAFTGTAAGSDAGTPANEAPQVAPHHVFWTAPHPIGFSAAPPRPTQEPPPNLPPFDPGAPDPVVVAVVDNGVDATLGWFGAPAAVRFLAGSDTADQPPGSGGTLDVFAGHGTFLAGVALAEAYRAAEGVEGLRPVEILSVRVTDGTGYISDEAAATGLYRLRDAVAAGNVPRPEVVLMAFGGFAHDGLSDPVPLVQGAVRALAADAALTGTVFVASAGNEGASRKVYPAALDSPRVAGVGATVGQERPGLSRAGFSNYGSWVRACASGCNILGPFTPVTSVFLPEVFGGPAFGPVSLGPTAVWSGTSMSGALVAGRLAGEVAARRYPDGVEAWRRLAAPAASPTVPGIGFSLVVLPEVTSQTLQAP